MGGGGGGGGTEKPKEKFDDDVKKLEYSGSPDLLFLIYIAICPIDLTS